MDNVKDRIIQGAGDLFLKNGIKAITMDDVASSLGISKRTIYEHFDDKQQLLKSCLANRACVKHSQMNQLAEQPVLEVLIAMLTYSSVTATESQQEHRFFMELKKYYPELHREEVENMHRGGIEQTKIFIEKGKSEGLFLKDTDSEKVSYLLMNQVEQIPQSTHYSRFSDLLDLFNHGIIIFFRGISTLEGVAKVDAELQKLYNVK